MTNPPTSLHAIVESLPSPMFMVSHDANLHVINLIKSATIQNYSCLSALVLLLQDYLYTLPDEIFYIWRQNLNVPKFAFLFVRYFGLLSQLANCFIAMSRQYQAPPSQSFCRGWFALQMTGYWVVLSASDIVLMWQVYYLYERSKIITAALISIFTAEVTVMVVGTYSALTTLQCDRLCNGVSAPPFVVVFGGAVIVCQAIVWLLRSWKTHDSWLNRRVIMIAITSDGTWLWIATCAILVGIAPRSYDHQIALPHVLFSWPVTLHSVGVSRLLLQQERCQYELSKESMMEQERVDPPLQLMIPFDVHSMGEDACLPEPSVSRATVEPLQPAARASALLRVDVEGQETDIIQTDIIQSSFNHETTRSESIITYSSRFSITSESEFWEESLADNDIEVGSMHLRSSIDSSERYDIWQESWS